VDFITSLDGYGAAEGWPGFWGLQGPEYLAWLGEQPERDYTILMGANTYRLMSGFAAEAETLEADEAAAVDELAATPKVVCRCSECVRGRLPLPEALRDELGALLLAPAVQHLEV
jgi:hypothetical protein